MPIVDIEIVLEPNETLVDSLASEIADELGRIFNSPSGTTWVKVYGLSADRYAENGKKENSIYPIFVKVIKSRLPAVVELQDEAKRISGMVANICGRPPENVHIIFEPNGAGRVAFGGRLVT